MGMSSMSSALHKCRLNDGYIAHTHKSMEQLKTRPGSSRSWERVYV